MPDGIQIEIKEGDFLKKTSKQQNLILYQAIMHLNQHGCRWAKTRTKKMYTVAGISGAIFGFLAGMGKSMIGK